MPKTDVPAYLVTMQYDGGRIKSGQETDIFDRFIQTSKPKSDIKSTGLGLAICKEILASHHGEIWAEQTVQGGGCLKFLLPKNKMIEEEK